MSLITTPTHPNANSYATLEEAESYFENLTNVEEWSSLTDNQKEALLKKATIQIDTLRIRKRKYFNYPIYNRDEQNLKFPTVDVRVVSGSVDGATANSFTDTARINNENEPVDYWNNGAVVITSGDAKGETIKISDFDNTSGVITLSSNFATTPSVGDQYRILYKIEDKIKYATFEQAIYNLNRDKESEAKKSNGVNSYRIGDLSEDFGESKGFGTGQVKVCDEAKGYLRGLYSIIGNFK